MIVTDLDHTLLNAHHGLDPLTIETFQALHRQGERFTIASGRHYQDIRAIRTLLGVPAHIISCNGASVHAPDDRLVFARQLDPAVLRELLSIPVDPSVRVNLFTADRWLIDAEAPDLLAYHAHTGFRYQVVPLAAHAADANKLLYIGHPPLLAEIERAIRVLAGERVSLTYSLDDCLEVMAPGVNKGAALQALHDLGLGPSIAFGDNLNDRELLEVAQQPYLMANAHPRLQRELAHVPLIGHHDEAGVARQLQRIFGLA